MTNKTIKPVFGIEIECAYNTDVLGSIRAARYHHARVPAFSNDFYAEVDGSLNESERYDNTVELISIPFQSKDVDKIISNFVTETYRRVSKRAHLSVEEAKNRFSLKNIYNFNGSCGCHMHVTPLVNGRSDYLINYKGTTHTFKGTPIPLRLLVTMKFLRNLENSIKSKVQTEVPLVYPHFNNQFFRGHSRRIESLYESFHSRVSFSLNRDLYRMEIRSFNLSGVKTWEEFEKTIKAGISAVEETFNNEYNDNNGFKDMEIFNFF